MEEADRKAVALFKTLRHQRLVYYEHDTSASVGPYPPAKTLYFSVIADFDVEAPNEERAGDLAEEVLEALATDEMQYIAFGFTAGAQRVRPGQRAARGEEAGRETEQESRVEGDEAEARKGRGRGSRGRGRKRRGERETDRTAEETPQKIETRPSESESVVTAQPEREEAVVQAETSAPEEPIEAALASTPLIRERELLPSEPTAVDIEISSPPPPRSSSAMRVTLSVSLHAYDLGFPKNGSGLPGQEELLTLATTEARRRHPELPVDVAPTHEIVTQPWGDTVLTLTWQYDVPVPSATEAA